MGVSMSQATFSTRQTDLLTRALGSVGHMMQDLAAKSFGPTSHTGPMVVSHDPAQDNLGSKLITIQNVQELKKIAGISDQHFAATPSADRSVRYPAAPVTDFAQAITRARNDNCTLESLVHPDDHAKIGQAMLAYVNGDSSKVSHYEGAINAMRFPAQAVLTVAQNVTITPQTPLIIGPNSPYITTAPGVIGAVCIFGVITIEPGGQIQVQIPVTIKAAQIIVQ
jgi:hypothetical protein